MAKPFAEFAGCSLHIHVSLTDKAGRNVFSGRTADGPFSDTLRHAVGGLAATMAEGMAIFAPNANSYRRYRPGLFVPLTPNWGINHRGVALRVPLIGAGGHAHRAPARRRGRQSIPGHGGGARRHTPRHHEALRARDP